MKNVVFTTLLSLSVITACESEDVAEVEEAMNANQSLQGTAWWVEDIAGKGVVDMSHTMIEFAEDGRVSGDTACNRYNGAVEISGNEISFGPMAGTRKACAAALMDQEFNFYQAIGKVVSWEVAGTGLLYMRDAEGQVQIRAAATNDP